MTPLPFAPAPALQVLLLGTGDSGKSTILKQMRLIHRVPFSRREIESYRQLVFNNITHGLKYLLDAMEDMGLEVLDENASYVGMVEDAQDLRDGQPFPIEYHEPLRKLWEDPNVQKCWERGNEAALPEKYVYYFHCRVRTLRAFLQPNVLLRRFGPTVRPILHTT